ncbi:MAG: uL15 family ribosomal protein [Nanoarchaeota archaeon]|nr:uL15 family ribosomal protein [Nanoarchaeota archaeon]
MRIKKRRKSSRFRGTHTHGRGFKKKARGSGHRGGKGLAGTGKRGDQRKSLILNLYGNDYFGKDKALRKKQPVKLKVINLHDISNNLHTFIKSGKAKESKDIVEVNLPGYKILAEGSISKKLRITASSASASAVDKVKKAGGEIILQK